MDEPRHARMDEPRHARMDEPRRARTRLALVHTSMGAYSTRMIWNYGKRREWSWERHGNERPERQS
eukprot:969400-Pleurochrysis_carterae.AAC.1